MEKKIVLGIDISKASFDVFLLIDGEGESAKFENKKSGFRKLSRWLKAREVTEVYACMEATGTYGNALCQYLYDEGHKVAVVNPYRVKCHGESQFRRNKTDKSDAKLNADFCLKHETRLWSPPPEEVACLQALTRKLHDFEKMKNRESNKLKTAHQVTKSSVRENIAHFQKQIKKIMKLIKQLFDEYPKLKEQKRLLETIPGIAAKSSELMLSEIIFDRYQSAKQVAAHAGVTPAREQSGTTINKTRISRKGNKRLRSKLYYPAMTAIRFNPIVKDLAERMEKNGKTTKQIRCAAIRKLLHISFGVIKSNRPFDPEVASLA